ncbi:hypothetical protein [Pseudomonas chlororaphis]|uniref:hypothetical protein n=1 Tax=Pseudomonas chlororaphis TaxID=587753 RepID=UPI001389D63D|nr:hypothetical protein [Pseudomonas chlororaphis]
MGSKATKRSDTLTSFLVFSSMFILIVLAVAIFAYRYKFGGDLSGNSSDWSNFGSYIGGVFGPLISFVTLLAVLRTVYLQRELLDTQRDEFQSMQVLQRDTFLSQQEQLRLAAEAAEKDQYNRTLDHLLSMVDRHVSLYEGIVDRATQGVQTLASWAFDGKPVKQEQIIMLANKNDRHKKTLDSLACLSIDLSMTKFNSIPEMREYYRAEMYKILESESSSKDGDEEVDSPSPSSVSK